MEEEEERVSGDFGILGNSGKAQCSVNLCVLCVTERRLVK